MPWLFKYKGKSDVWWVGYRLHGQQFLRSTGYRERDKAEQELQRLNAMVAAQKANALSRDLFQQLTGKAIPNKPLKVALDEWLSEVKVTTGDRTTEKYTSFANDLGEFLRANDRGPLLVDVTRDDLQRYLGERLATTTAGTANMARKCMAIFFKQAKVKGLLRDNPVDTIPLFKPGRDELRSRRPFKLAELSKLYQHAPDDFWRYMVLAGFFTGLRLGDLVTIPIGAIDLRARTINTVSRKTGTQMHIPIAPRLHSLLKALVKARAEAKPSDPLWPDQCARYEKSGSGWFSQRFYDLLLVKSGIAKRRPHRSGTKSHKERRTVSEVSFHCFRHSYVSTLAALGHNQQVVKALAGHSDDAVNDLYTHVPIDVLKDAIGLLPDITKP